MKISNKLNPILGLCIGILSISTASLLIRFAQQQAPSLVIAAGRMALAALLLMPFAFTRSWGEIKVIPKRTLLLLMLSGLFLGLHFATWITSLEYTSVASSVVLVCTAPLWVALLSPIFLKEKSSLVAWIGLFISLAGSFIVGLNTNCEWMGNQLNCIPLSNFFDGKAALGNLLALAGALFVAGYMLIGRRVRNELSLLAYTFLVYSTAAVVLIILVVVTNTPVNAYPVTTWVWISLLAILPQLIGHSTFNYFLKTIPAVFVSIAQLGEPIGTIFLAYLFLHEAPAFLEICGGVLILVGILISGKANQLKNKNQQAEPG